MKNQPGKLLRRLKLIFKGLSFRAYLFLLSLCFILLCGAFYIISAQSAWRELGVERTELSEPVVLSHLKQLNLTKETGVQFAVLGDPRGGDNILAEQLNDATRRGAKFAIILGDLVTTGSQSHYLDLAERLEAAPLPILTIPGNHDVGHQGAYYYERLFGPLNYSFDLAGYHFIMLDNSKLKLTPGQLAWYENQLTNPLPKLVFIHVPPALVRRWAWHSFANGADQFVALNEKYQPQVVFMSHIHAYDRMNFKGVVYIVSGGGGTQLTYNLGKKAAIYHYILVKTGPRGVSQQVIRFSGPPTEQESAAGE